MANSLAADELGYVLIGVENNGTICGITTPHTDDADLHSKVRPLLNARPRFQYAAVDVDGASVGVYEIRGGGRPFFPIVDSQPSLWRHVALYRDGTATDRASPTIRVGKVVRPCCTLACVPCAQDVGSISGRIRSS